MKCPNCGANIKKSKECAYCGYEIEEKASKTEQNEAVFTKEIKTLAQKHITKANKSTTIAFMVFWVLVTFGMGITSITEGAPIIFALVPMGMGIFGAIAMIGSLKSNKEVNHDLNSNIKLDDEE